MVLAAESEDRGDADDVEDDGKKKPENENVESAAHETSLSWYCGLRTAPVPVIG